MGKTRLQPRHIAAGRERRATSKNWQAQKAKARFSDAHRGAAGRPRKGPG